MEVNTSVNVDENNKRKRAITSTSEADTSIAGDSEHNTSVGQDKSKKLNVQTESVDKTDKKKQKSKKKSKKAKTSNESDDEWLDVSFKESVQTQLSEISEVLTKVVSKTEIENIFTNLLEKKMETLMTHMKDKIIETVTHRIEVLEGELHDASVENKMLSAHIERLEKEIETKTGTISKLQRSLEDTDKAFYGRTNEIEQHGRRNSIRIWGIPEEIKQGEKYEAAETTVTLVTKALNEKMGLNLQHRDIDIAHRLGPKTRHQADRCIIAKFTSRMNKIKCMKDRKKKLEGTGIRIQEDLTKLNLAVLKATWKNDKVEKSWTTDGIIFVKWKGTGTIKKLEFHDYAEWLDSKKE